MQYEKLKIFQCGTSHDARVVLCDKQKHRSCFIKVDESTDLTNKFCIVAFARLVNAL